LLVRVEDVPRFFCFFWHQLREKYEVDDSLNVTSEISAYWGHFPERRGKIFQMIPMTFRSMFYQRAKEAGIPEELAHPHILRHTRALELLRSGVPVTAVQDILGHSSLSTMAIYLRLSGQEAKSILKDKGFI